MKVKWRKRELFEGEKAAEKMAELKGGSKLSYAVLKSCRIVKNEAQDLRVSIQMKEKDYKNVVDYEEKKRIYLNDSKLSSEQKINILNNLDEKYPGARYAVEMHARENNEILREDIELELHEIKSEWLPADFEIGALGPFIDIVTGI